MSSDEETNMSSNMFYESDSSEDSATSSVSESFLDPTFKRALENERKALDEARFAKECVESAQKLLGAQTVAHKKKVAAAKAAASRVSKLRETSKATLRPTPSKAMSKPSQKPDASPVAEISSAAAQAERHVAPKVAKVPKVKKSE